MPENLIDQVQISLRKEALLEFFNPNDPSIPPPPTLEEAIAGIGTSDDPFRCKHCKGEFLRGSESIICVYCGHGQQQEFPPEPIAFKSTLGFGWLLQSLRLDGSESVGPSIGITESNREQSSLKDGVALSDFLDLDLKWPDESKRFGVTNESQLVGERPSTLVGVNLNGLFPEESKDKTSSVFSEQVRTTKKFETKETAKFAGQRSLNFFAATQSSESVLRSNERENDVSFSGWEAEFQSAVPDGGHEHLHSFEASEGPSAGNASHINPVKGHFEMENSANMSSSHTYPRNDFTEDDLDFNFALPSHSKQSEGSILVEDIGKVFEPVDVSSGFTWPLDDLQKTAIADPSFVESRDTDDSFDQWNDFRSSTDVVNSHCEASTTASAGTENRGRDVSDGWKNFTESISTVSNHPRTNILQGPNDDSLDVWNDLKVPSSVGGIKWQTRSSDICQQEKRHDVGEPILGGNNFASLNATLQDGQDIHANASQNKAFSQDDSVRLWNSVIGMTVLDDQLLVSETKSPAIGTSKEAHDSLNLWNDFKSSNIETQQLNSAEAAVNNMSAKVGKTSDVWNDFSGLGTSRIEGKIWGAKTVNGSFASWNDHSFNAWNDLTETSGASVSKPISNDISYGEWNEFSSSAISHTDRDQSSGKKAAESRTVLGHDDSFISWGNLTGSVTLAENSFPSTVTESGQGQISTGKACETLKVMEESISLDACGDFGHSVLMQEKHAQAEQIELSKNEQDGDDNDFLSGWIESSKQSASPWGNQVSSNGGIEHDAKSISENDDSFDEWTGFASSSNVPNQSLSSSANAPAANEAVKHDDMFDSWNVFTSSSNVQAGNNTIVPEENVPEISLFSSNASSQGVEYESSYQQEMLLRVTSDQNGSSSVVSPAEVPDVVRMENGGGKADDYSEQINRSETSSKGTADLKSCDVEILISEMHDLSFMLENSLSIPKSE